MVRWIQLYTKHAFDFLPALTFPWISLTMEALDILCKKPSPRGWAFDMAVAEALATALQKNKQFKLKIAFGTFETPQDKEAAWQCLNRILIRSVHWADPSLLAVSKDTIESDVLPFWFMANNGIKRALVASMTAQLKREQQRSESAPTATTGVT